MSAGRGEYRLKLVTGQRWDVRQAQWDKAGQRAVGDGWRKVILGS